MSDFDLAWSPDGKRIVCDFVREGNEDIYVIEVDNRRLTRLTDDRVKDLFPAWSPDGARIAFVSGANGEEAIYVMQADGSTPTRLTAPTGANNPAWSPDGRFIAYSYYGDIYLMAADGRRPRNLTHAPESQRRFAWAPK